MQLFGFIIVAPCNIVKQHFYFLVAFCNFRVIIEPDHKKEVIIMPAINDRIRELRKEQEQQEKK